MVTREELNARFSAYNQLQQKKEKERQEILEIGQRYFDEGNKSSYATTEGYRELRNEFAAKERRRPNPTSLSAEELDLLMRGDSGAKYSAQGLQNALNLENRTGPQPVKYTVGKFLEGAAKGVSNLETLGRVVLANEIDKAQNTKGGVFAPKVGLSPSLPDRTGQERESKLASERKLATNNTTEKLLGLDEYSASLEELAKDLGDKALYAGDVASGIGGMAPAIATSVALRNPNAGMGVMSMSAAGAAAERAIEGGATLGEATKTAVISGVKEYLIEKLMGGIAGFGKGFLDPKLGKYVSDSGIVRYLVNSLGEGSEEVLSEAIQQVIDKNIWKSNQEKTTFKDYVKTFGIGATIGAILGLPVAFNSNASKGETTTKDGKTTKEESGKESREEEKQRRILQRIREIDETNPSLTWTDKQYRAVSDMVEREMDNEGKSTFYSSGSIVSETPNVESRLLPSASVDTINAQNLVDVFEKSGYAPKDIVVKLRDFGFDEDADLYQRQIEPTNASKLSSGVGQTAMKMDEGGFDRETVTQSLRNKGYDEETVSRLVNNLFGKPVAETKATAAVTKEKPMGNADVGSSGSVATDKTANGKPKPEPVVRTIFKPKEAYISSKLPKENRVSNVYNTFDKSGTFTKEEMEKPGLRAEDFTYDVLHNADSVAQAAKRLTKDYEGEKTKLGKKGEWDAVDLDVSMQFVHDAINEARKNGDYSEVAKWAKLIREKGTAAGQFIQAFDKYSKTPEGVMIKSISVMESSKVDEKTQKDVVKSIGEFSKTLDAVDRNDVNALIDIIRKQAEKRKTKFGKAEEFSLRQQDTEYLYNFALAQMENIAKDYQDVSFGQKLSVYQAIAHLLNFKTTNRNVVSNSTFDIVDAAAQDVSMIPDAILSLLTGKRTVGFDRGMFSKNKYAGAIKRGARAFAEVSLDVDVSSVNNKYNTGASRVNKAASNSSLTRIMSAAEKALGVELSVTDEIAKGGIVAEITQSLKPFVENGSMTEAEAIEFAEMDARYRTFQDENVVSATLSGLRDVLNLVGFGTKNGKTIKGMAVKDFGLGDLLQKYTQVPGSLITRSIEFSPAGYAKAIYLLCKADNGGIKNMTNQQQRNLALSIGRATTGTGLIIAAATLAKAGILSDADGEEDKDRKALLSAQGINGTQINLDALARWISGGSTEWESGDDLVSVDFMEPLNSLFATGYLVAQDPEINIVGANIDGIYRSIKDITTMQSIASINNAIQYHDEDSGIPLLISVPIEVFIGSLSGFVPSLIRQTSRAIDPFYRETYNTSDRVFGEGEGWEEFGQSAIDKIKSATPFSKTLPEKLDPFGRAKEYGDSELERWINAFVAPGNVTNYEVSDVEKEIERLFENRESVGADYDAIFPSRNAPSEIRDIELSGSEKQEFLETRGQTTYDAIQELIKTPEYQNAMNSEKAEMISEALKYGNYAAKMEFYDSKNMEVEDNSDGKLVFELVDAGFSDADALIIYSDLSEQKSDGEKRALLYDSNYNDEEIARIAEVYGLASDRCNEVWNEAESLNIPYRKYLEAYYIIYSNKTGYKKAERITDVKALGIDGDVALKLWDMIRNRD